MHPSKCDGKALVGKSSHEAGRRGRPSRRAKRFYQQYFEQVGEDHFARRTPVAELLSYELYKGGKSRLAAHMHNPGK